MPGGLELMRMKTRYIIAMLVAFSGVISSTFGAYQMRINFDGYGAGRGTLINFPALIVLSNNVQNSGFDYATFTDPVDGGDLRFLADDLVTPLNFEVEEWSTGGVSYIWVQVPLLTNNTAIYATWGGGDTTPPDCTTNGATWSVDYVGVWHLHNTNGPNVFPDSTSGGHDGVNNGSANVVGKIGDAQDFTRSAVTAGDYITLDNGALTSVANEVTVSMWVYGDAGVLPAETVAFKAEGTERELGSHLPWSNGNIYWDAHYINGGSDDRISKAHAVAEPGEVAGQWNCWAFTKDAVSGSMKIYYNGVLWHSGTGKTQPIEGSTVTNFLLGASGDVDQGYDGYIDEFRVSKVERSADWVWANYTTANSHDALASYGAVGATGLPAVTGSGATGVAETVAWVNGSLTSTGTASTTVYLYWGDNDAGDVTNSWDTRAVLVTPSPMPVQSFTKQITSLATNTTYYYRFLATNDARTHHTVRPGPARRHRSASPQCRHGSCFRCSRSPHRGIDR